MTDAAQRAPVSDPPAIRPAPFGSIAAVMDAVDWDASPIGPPEGWSPALVHTFNLILPAEAQIVLFWGDDYVAIYNAAYVPAIGGNHPRAFGRPACENWAELWDDLRPLLDRVRLNGETVSSRDRPFVVERHGYSEEVFFDISYSPVRGASGAVEGIMCIVSDTTERVRAARAVAADRERLATMFDRAPGFMALLRQPGHVFEFANPSYMELIGPHQVIGRRVADVLPGVAAQGFISLLDDVAATGQPYRGEAVRIALPRAADGSIEERWVDFVYQPLTDGDGRVTAIFVEGNDVTERHAAEQRLLLSQQTLALATDAAEVGIWDVDLVADTLSWSDRTKAHFGIAPGTFVTMDDFYAGLHPDDLAPTSAAFASALDPARRAVYDVEYRTVGATDGVVRWVAAKGRGLFDDGGRCLRALGTTLDITARRAVEADLREREERFRTLADSAPALIWVMSADGELAFANRWFETLFGQPADSGRQVWRDRVHPDDRARFSQLYAQANHAHAPWNVDVRVQDREGAWRWIHAEGQPRFTGEGYAGHVGCAVDVTDAHLAAEALEQRVAERTAELTRQIEERERAEATLHRMQRLEAVGQLTSGVAHDFNNLLTVVLGNIGLVERVAAAGELDARSRQRLEHIRIAAERGAALTGQLLAFSRRQRLEAKTVNLNDTVRGMQDLLGSSLGGAITIETRLAEPLWPALVDPTQIELIILNLAINARDAMPGGGTLTVETANVTLGAPTRAEEPPQGDYVLTAVRDTGTGMTDEVLAKAFEPFFTTKEVGKGSGLGLAQVYGFAKQSGGGVRIDTAPGRGTTVSVYLPRTGPVAAPAPAAEPIADSGVALVGRVLVLDDDEAVRAVTAASLAEIGCQVVEAGSGLDALERLAADPSIGAAVADFAMPGMNGAEFARHARARRPDLPILFVTGYAEVDALADVEHDCILQKPYRARDLQQRVRKCLSR